ncbi:cyanophycinase [Leptolyngbya sp. AN02str]|uniref:cyanophycinase n=1 Tax=Leptolyngbya sp. AN02str TaxID=3423363 RepID=UPI003D323D9D
MNERSYSMTELLKQFLIRPFKPDTMLQTEPTSLRQRMPQTTNTSVLVIGGAEDKVHGRLILSTFFSRSGGSDARIAIVPAASREPAVIGNRYQEIFESMGAKTIEIVNIQDREHGYDSGWLSFIEDCTGVFLTGGDQLRLCGLLADTPIMEKIRLRAQLGEITLAGTSAGAAVMGQHMIAGGGSGESPNRSLVDLTAGLNIIPEVLVDQHFHNRNRMARLMSAIAAYPDKLGIGIDEDTCAMFEADGTFRVLGKGTVTIIDPGEISYTNQADVGTSDPLSIHNMRIHILSHGDRYDFYKRVILPSTH